MERQRGYGNAAGWFLAGSFIGACTALLLAPATGKRTRDRLTRRVRQTKESVTDMADDLADTTRHIVEKVGDISDEAMRMAGKATATAREAVGALGNRTFGSRH